jgi:hypothetical protein
MNGEILRAVLEKASALIADLPAEIQQVAFVKAFDALLEERTAGAQRNRRPTRRQLQPRASSAGLRTGGGGSRRVGPKLALGQLLDSGYFVSSRGLPEIQRHLRDSYGHDYGSNELSISLLRLIRDGRLSRQKDLAGQYEYWAEGLRGQPAPEAPPAQTRARARLLTDGRGR